VTRAGTLPGARERAGSLLARTVDRRLDLEL